MTRSQQIVLASIPDGELRPTDLRLEEIELPAAGDGQVLLETIFLSIDPYMRWLMRREKSYAVPLDVGQVIVGGTVCRIRRSRHPDWAEGEWVLAASGWRRFALSDGTGLRRIDPNSAPPSTALGVLGMPGFTAYAGLRNIGRPEPGETVVVAAASGAVGSAVGQIARLRGARAVGITTGRDKLAYVRDELGFDDVVDHRAADFARRLADSCPCGIDVYFENVGGAVWDAVLPLMNVHGRVPVCGLIAQYEARAGATHGTDRFPGAMAQVLGKSLTLRGFIQSEFADAQYADFMQEAGPWFEQGRLRHREDIRHGLDAAPAALIDVLNGGNFGKTIVQVGTP